MSPSGASVVVAHTAQKTANGNRPCDRDAAAKGCGDQTATGGSDARAAIAESGGDTRTSSGLSGSVMAT